MEPGDRLREARTKADLSVEQLAERVQKAPSTVRAHENGQNGIKAPMADRYARALGASPEWLLYGRGSPDPASVEPVLQALPLIGQIRAGAWLALDDSVQDEPQMLSAALDSRYPHAKQWLREVVGDSMNAKGIMSGDLAHIVDWGDSGLALTSGQVVEVTQFRDGGELREVTLKEVEVRASGGFLLWPRSTNPRWKEPLLLNGEDDSGIIVQVTGLLLAAIRRF